MKTLTRRTGTALDTRGCEFRYTMRAEVTGDKWTRTGRLAVVRERVYESMGIQAASLDDLKRKIGELE